MAALKKPVSALIGVLAVLLAGVFFAVSASANPTYPVPSPSPGAATLTVSDSTPAAGSADTVTGTGYQANEAVSLEGHSVVTGLGTAQADASGSFTMSVTIPNNFSGAHEIVGTGLTSGEVASADITVSGGSGSGSGGSGGSSGSGSGGLSNTGVAVIGIGALGVVLLVGGGLLLMAGKRRKVSI